MIKILKQLISFILISGVGFILDFTIYYLLVNIVGVKLAYANMISAIPAVTYVFLVSTRKTFNTKKSKISLVYKYLIYFIYQIFLVTLISFLAQILYDKFYEFSTRWIIIENNFKMIIKCLITPITMTCNFLVMKILCEKI
jgi:putative flippase GtrA